MVGSKLYVSVGLLLLGSSAALVGLTSRVVATPSETGVLASLVPRDSAPQILVAFHLADCGSRIGQLRGWNAVHLRDARLFGVLLGTRADLADVRRMLDGSGIDFPLALDSNAVIARAIQDAGYVRTPVVLVVDRRGRVRLIDRPSWDVDGWDDANRERVIGFARSLVGVDDR